MAQVTIPRDVIERGELPPVCAVTGQEADGTVAVQFNALPPWSWVLLLVGVIPFLVANALAPTRVEGRVPVVRPVVERFDARRGLGMVALLAGGLGWITTGLTDATWPTWPFVLLTIAGIAAWVRAYRSFVDGQPVNGGTHVRLLGVHPGFVAAVSGHGRE